jgi:hypothetical protein
VDRDIDRVIAALEVRFPGIRGEQLRVTREADDDGLWFFTHSAVRGEVQLESSTGQVPFLVEGSDSPLREMASTVEEAAALVAARLGLAAASSI